MRGLSGSLTATGNTRPVYVHVCYLTPHNAALRVGYVMAHLSLKATVSITLFRRPLDPDGLHPQPCVLRTPTPSARLIISPARCLWVHLPLKLGTSSASVTLCLGLTQGRCLRTIGLNEHVTDGETESQKSSVANSRSREVDLRANSCAAAGS